MKKFVTIFIAIFACVTLNAQEVITLSQGHNVGNTASSPVIRPIGPSIRFSIGVPELITAAFNYQITPWFMIGGGTGYGMATYSYTHTVPAHYISSTYQSDGWTYTGDGVGRAIPLFVEAEVRTPKYKWFALFNIKIGANIYTKTSNAWKEGREYFITDYYGNAIYSETTITRHPLFISTAIGFGYKNLSMGFGLGFFGNKIGSDLFMSYNLPLKK